MNFLMVFDFTQFWLDGRPGNEYFWISHKISGLLTPLDTPGCASSVIWNHCLKQIWVIPPTVLWPLDFRIQKKNSFRGNYMRKYGIHYCLIEGGWWSTLVKIWCTLLLNDPNKKSNGTFPIRFFRLVLCLANYFTLLRSLSQVLIS